IGVHHRRGEPQGDLGGCTGVGGRSAQRRAAVLAEAGARRPVLPAAGAADEAAVVGTHVWVVLLASWGGAYAPAPRFFSVGCTLGGGLAGPRMQGVRDGVGWGGTAAAAAAAAGPGASVWWPRRPPHARRGPGGCG